MRLVYIANRLPVKIEHRNNSYELRPSPGGVASGLKSYLESLSSEQKRDGYLWIGWPGSPVEEEDHSLLREKLLREHTSYPVFLTQTQVDGYYNGFCNKVIWPLFHYFLNFIEPSEEYWHSYKEVNKHFAEQIAPLLRSTDVISIQDYQLLLLPQYLRNLRSDLSVSLFLHIPFPPLDIFRLLPFSWRQELLDGMLGADLIGFHTHEYRQHFLMSTLRLLGAEHRAGKLLVNNRIVASEVFPMGIDYQRFSKASKSSKVSTNVKKMRQSLGEKKLIFSVDRLDYSKGITNRLQGYQLFLKKYPEWQGKVTLIVSSEPSRTDIEQYKTIKRSVDEMIGRINGEYGNLSWQPILYQYTSLSFEDMVALYKVSDVALITPLRDGMNLIAKEYIASLSDQKGVLILSEMAGSAKELKEALIINPFDIDEIANAIFNGLTMSVVQQKKKNSLMQARLEKYDVKQWASDLTSSLQKVKKEQRENKSILLTGKNRSTFIEKYKISSRRLLLFDYDGTLVPFSSKPQLAKPTKKVLSFLTQLSNDHRNEVVLISGRDKNTLESWFPVAKLALVAEHGVWKKERQEYYWKMLGKFSSAWKSSLLSLLQQWVDRVPKSFIEEKEFSLAWHYRQVDDIVANTSIKEILYEITDFISSTNAEVIHGNKVIEIKNVGADKGTAAQQWIQKKNYDLCVAVGDDVTDEDLFEVMPDDSYTIKVGEGLSNAKYRVKSVEDLHELIQELIDSDSVTKNEKFVSILS